MRPGKKRGCLASLFGLAILSAAVVYLTAAITAPWAFHIGGEWTPLLHWTGVGDLATKSGTYPLYVMLRPGGGASRLKLDGLRPSGGMAGSASLCRAGQLQYLKLEGTIYGGWRSTEGSVMAFRLLELKLVDVGQGQGFFDLYGKWDGPELVMSDRGELGSRFRSGLKIEQASVRLRRGSYGEFESMCRNR